MAGRARSRTRPGSAPTSSRSGAIRAVLWTVYGTLLAIPEGELKFEVENDFVMNVALDKTIHEFKMWGSMSRKPGQPAEYMREIYRKTLDEQRLAPAPDRYPEVLTEKVWEGILKKLFQKDYQFDAGFYGALNEYAKKVAYFFHASLQGTGAYPNAAAALKSLSAGGIVQGLLADGQCFTPTQLGRGVAAQDETVRLDEVDPAGQPGALTPAPGPQAVRPDVPGGRRGDGRARDRAARGVARRQQPAAGRRAR